MNPGDPLAEGHILDRRYRIRKVLGVGGMGRVYLSNDTRLASRPVAVKEMILGEGIAEKKAVEDFTREASVLAHLTHPGIPTLIDHFIENGRHYMVMEFVAGGDLDKLIQQTGGKLPEEQVIRWARQILSVLEFLHSQTPPIVYRDLKPGNIMIDKDGRAMLIDFGIARFLPRGGRATQIGSPGYAPPEQYMGKVEPRSDLYSLAATLHHLTTGRDPTIEPPFSFPPVRQIAPNVSFATATAIDRALEHDIQRRFGSAHEMLNALPQVPDFGVEDPAAHGRTVTPMRTVLSTPVASPTVSSPGAPAASRLGSSQPAAKRPEAIMPTVVLSKPAMASSTSTTQNPATSAASNAISPPVKKAIELGFRAKALIERGLKSKIVSSMIEPAGAEPQVSSTAKTQDLKRPGSSPSSWAGSSAAPATRTESRSSSVGSSRGNSRAAASTPSLFDQTNSQPSAPSAKLIVRGESTEHVLRLARTVIGRSQSSTDAIDIDLASLSRGAERVSRAHAEVLRRGSAYFIRDLGSLNGTYIAGRGRLGRDQLYELKDRDQIVLGSAILQFRRG